MIYYTKEIQKKETLQIIRQLESGDGRNINHNSDAYGLYGIKPSTAKEIGFEISSKNEHKVASFLYDDISRKLHTSDPNIIVYAWLMGVYGAKRQINKPIPYRGVRNHWHVKKYRAFINPYKQFLIDKNLTYTQFSPKSI